MMRSLILVVLACTTARADPTPWTAGVSPEHQQRANALFADGNEAFARQAHVAALAKYRSAIAIWDHPMIRFNMAVSLIRLERYVEAAENLDRALRFGAAPFTKELYVEALDYRKLVDKRVGSVEVTCTQRGALVYLDGTAWFGCPDTRRRRLPVGEHLLVAELSRHATMSSRITIAGGETYHAQIELRAVAAAGALEYPSPRWLPWAIAGAGAAVVGGGFAIWTDGRREMDAAARELAQRCPPACDDLWSEQRDQAQRKGMIGTSIMVAGGAVAVGGLVWSFINRPRSVGPRVELAPISGGGVARAAWQF